MDLAYISFNYGYWTWIGTLYLLILTWQDYRNKMWVDDRKNAFMMGATLSLMALFEVWIWYLLALILLMVVFRWYAAKRQVFGEADINTLSWVFMGFGIIGVYSLVVFAVAFIFGAGIYEGGRRFIFKHTKPAPFYIVILVTFIASSVLLGLYW